MPGTAVTKSVVANEPGGRKREEIFVDIIEKISVTFSSSVSINYCCFTAAVIFLSYSSLVSSPQLNFYQKIICIFQIYTTWSC